MKFRALNWDYHGDAISLQRRRNTSSAGGTPKQPVLWLRAGYYERERWTTAPTTSSKTTNTISDSKQQEINCNGDNDHGALVIIRKVQADLPKPPNNENCTTIGTTSTQTQCQPQISFPMMIFTIPMKNIRPFFFFFDLWNHGSGKDGGRACTATASWSEDMRRQLWQAADLNMDDFIHKSQGHILITNHTVMDEHPFLVPIQLLDSSPVKTSLRPNIQIYNSDLLQLPTAMKMISHGMMKINTKTATDTTFSPPSKLSENLHEHAISKSLLSVVLMVNDEQQKEMENKHPTSVMIEELERLDDKDSIANPTATTIYGNHKSVHIPPSATPTAKQNPKNRSYPDSVLEEEASNDDGSSRVPPQCLTLSLSEVRGRANNIASIDQENSDQNSGKQKSTREFPHPTKEDSPNVLSHDEIVTDKSDTLKKKHKRSKEERKAYKKERKALKKEKKRKRQEEEESTTKILKHKLTLPRSSVVQAKSISRSNAAEEELHTVRSIFTKKAQEHRKAFSQIQILRTTITEAPVTDPKSAPSSNDRLSLDKPQSSALEHLAWAHSQGTKGMNASVFAESSIGPKANMYSRINSIDCMNTVDQKNPQRFHGRLWQSPCPNGERNPKPPIDSNVSQRLTDKHLQKVPGKTFDGAIAVKQAWMDIPNSVCESDDLIRGSRFQPSAESNVQSMDGRQEKPKNLPDRPKTMTMPCEQSPHAHHGNRQSMYVTGRNSQDHILTQFSLQPADNYQNEPIASLSNECFSHDNHQRPCRDKQPPVPCVSSLPALQFLCSENFLENWGFVVAELASGRWANEPSNLLHPQDSNRAGRKISLIDTPLLGACGVDIESPGRCGYLVYATSALASLKEAKQIVMEVAELASIGRYNHLKIWICHDVPASIEITKHIVKLHCSVLDISGNIPTKVSFKTATQKTLARSLAATLLKSPKPSPESLELQDGVIRCAHDKQIQERSLFLLSLLPLLNASGAIQCILLAKKLLPPGSPSFRMLFQNQRLRQQIMLQSTSQSLGCEVHPAAMPQLSLILQLGL